MFESQEDALSHRDAVHETFIEEFGEGQPMQISPVLDGAKLKVADLDPEEVQNTMEEAGYSTTMIGEGPDGDWFEMKVKP